MLSKKCTKIFLGLFALFFIGFANGDPQENLIKEKFSVLQKEYFLKLDLRAPQKKLQAVIPFAAKFNALADEQRRILAVNKNLSKNDKELAGLIFIYDAMLNANIIIGTLEGKLSLAGITQQELQARAKHGISELEMAAHLRPNDHRIDSWIVGVENLVGKPHQGHISKATQIAILKTISARPSFNLWTAILMLHNESAASKQELLQAAKNFIEAANQGKDPCTLHPEDCVSTWKAPYNFQASVTELGDVFLQQAEYYLKKGDVKKAMTLAEYANGIYAQLFKPKHQKATLKWPDYDGLVMRKKRLAEIQNRKVPKESLLSMDGYQKVYECASCHGRVPPSP